MMMSPYAAIFFAGCLEARAYGQQLSDADAVVELGPDALADRADHFAAVAAGVDVGAERPLPGGQPDHTHDLVGDFRGVVAAGEDAGHVLVDDLAQLPVELLVFGGPPLVGGRAGVGEVVA
jgi:hypothetical protein